MNAGFSSLTALKAHLLNESLRSDTTYDAPIISIGLGMASLFDGYLNRKLGRVVGDTFVQRGGKKMMLLPRYPVEAVTQIEARVGNGDPWEGSRRGSAWRWSSRSSCFCRSAARRPSCRG